MVVIKSGIVLSSLSLSDHEVIKFICMRKGSSDSGRRTLFTMIMIYSNLLT